MNLQFPTVWNLIERFKERCQSSGWETCETEDLIKTEDGEYHSFLWTQTIHPSTFERIANKPQMWNPPRQHLRGCRHRAYSMVISGKATRFSDFMDQGKP